MRRNSARRGATIGIRHRRRGPRGAGGWRGRCDRPVVEAYRLTTHMRRVAGPRCRYFRLRYIRRVIVRRGRLRGEQRRQQHRWKEHQNPLHLSSNLTWCTYDRAAPARPARAPARFPAASSMRCAFQQTVRPHTRGARRSRARPAPPLRRLPASHRLERTGSRDGGAPTRSMPWSRAGRGAPAAAHRGERVIPALA